MSTSVPALTAEPGAGQRRLAWQAAARRTALMGIAHALLFLLAFFLMLIPGGQARGADLERVYTDENHRRLVVAGLYVMPFAGIAFIWFSVLLRSWIQGSSRRIDRLFSDVQLVAGIIYVTMFFIAASSISVTAASMEISGIALDPGVAVLFPQLGNAVFFVFGMRMAGMFVMTTAKIVGAATLLPKWFSLLSYPVALFLFLSGTFSHWLIVVFPAWLIILCLLVLDASRRLDSDAASRFAREHPAAIGPFSGE